MKKGKPKMIRCETIDKGMVRWIPEHLANKQQLMSRMGLVRADVKYVDEASMQQVKGEFAKYIDGINDVDVLNGMVKFDSTRWKVDIIKARIDVLSQSISTESPVEEPLKKPTQRSTNKSTPKAGVDDSSPVI